MTKTKSTKRALLTSALALLMCVSMLIGSTFAWFTDSVTSGNNKIVSGNLDVVLEYKTDWDDAWTVVDENTKIFKEGALYEPGYTEVVFLRVSNAGSLALKYSLMVDIASEKSSINVDGKEFNLSDYLQIGAYTQSEYASGANYADLLMPIMFGTRESALSNVDLAKLSTADSIVSSDTPVLVGEDTAQVTALVLTMPTTVGNEANYDANVAAAPEINLGVNLVATQHMEEKDSFGNDYDKDATYPGDFVGGKGTAEDPYLVNGASQLLSISDYYDEYTYFKVADGVKTLDLTSVGRINLNGSFDGNGVEITGLTTALFEFVGKVGDPQDIKISNFTATVNTTDGRALVKNINNSGTTTFENVALHGYIEGEYNMGSFYNYGTANNSVGSDGANYTVSFVNATSDATLVCTTGNAIGGMLGHGFEGANYKLSINMDEKSGYTGKMYTTGTATCYEVMAMCSHSTYILNGVEVSRYDADAIYPSTKLAVSAPTVGADGYYVAPVDGVDHYVVSLNSQLTAYDANGVKIPNKAGMTWVLGEETITEGFDGKIFDLVETAVIVNGEDHEFGYELNNGALTIYSGRVQNYASGWVTLYVNQYDANGTVLATGKISVYTFAEPNA